jgi:hypothetical protein
MVLAGIDNDQNCRETYEHELNNSNPWTNKPPIYIENDVNLDKRQIQTAVYLLLSEYLGACYSDDW